MQTIFWNYCNWVWSWESIFITMFFNVWFFSLLGPGDLCWLFISEYKRQHSKQNNTHLLWTALAWVIIVNINIKTKTLINVLINLVEADTSLNFYNFLPVLTTDAKRRMRTSNASASKKKHSDINIFHEENSLLKEIREPMNNNSNLSVKHEIALINGVATRIASARSIEENICIVVIPGNPGGIGFYDIFISTIFQAGKGKYSVYGVSHAGKVNINLEKNN